MKPGSTATASTRRRPLTYAVIAIASVLVAIVGVRLGLTLGPMGAAQDFCAAAQRGDYAGIYAHMFAAAARAQSDGATFTAAEQLADQQAGAVTSCDISPLRVDGGWGSAVVRLTEHRAHGVDVAVALQMSGAPWHITSIPDPAVFPLGTARAFCDDLTRQDYTAAYHLLAPSITGALTSENFAKAEQLFDQNGGVVDTCTVTALTLNSANTFGVASVQVHRRQSGSGAIQIKIARQSGGSWRISSLPSA
jgi:hypothetical protein